MNKYVGFRFALPNLLDCRSGWPAKRVSLTILTISCVREKIFPAGDRAQSSKKTPPFLKGD